MTLAELKVGQGARVAEVSGEVMFRLRLLELGLVPGTHVVRVGQAPLGDPLTYRLRGAVMTLRRSDAQQIRVELA